MFYIFLIPNEQPFFENANFNSLRTNFVRIIGNRNFSKTISFYVMDIKVKFTPYLLCYQVLKGIVSNYQLFATSINNHNSFLMFPLQTYIVPYIVYVNF